MHFLPVCLLVCGGNKAQSVWSQGLLAGSCRRWGVGDERCYLCSLSTCFVCFFGGFFARLKKDSCKGRSKGAAVTRSTASWGDALRFFYFLSPVPHLATASAARNFQVTDSHFHETRLYFDTAAQRVELMGDACDFAASKSELLSVKVARYYLEFSLWKVINTATSAFHFDSVYFLWLLAF